MSNDSKLSNQESKATITDNKVVTFHYRLSEVLENGIHSDWLEDSFGKQPLKYLQGFHNVIVGLERALAGKSVGDRIGITLSAEEAYGQRHEDSIRRVSNKHIRLPRGQRKLRPGMKVAVETANGLKEVIVAKVGKFNVDVDLNHPYAGKTLYYEIEVVDIREATKEEIDHGHVHGDGGHNH